jgi:hypothetical protein
VTAPDVLVSDEDRQQAARDVEAAAACGLLTLAEADARLREVWHARTRSALDATRADLPREWLAGRRRRDAAQRAAEHARRSLPRHATSWLVLMGLLVLVWALTTPGGYFWPVWPALGTAPCLLAHVAAGRRATPRRT